MGKKYFIFYLSLIVILVLTICYLKMHNNRCLPEELVVESFNSSGAHFINSEMSFEASLSEECQNEKYLNRLMVELAYRLGINLNSGSAESYLDIVENDYMYKLELNGNTECRENINICVKLLKVSKEPVIPGYAHVKGTDIESTSIEGIDVESIDIQSMKAKSESFKTVSSVTNEKYQGGVFALVIKGSEPYGRLQDIGKIVESVFKKYNIKPEFNCFITGYFEGKLDHGRMNEVCKNVFHTAEAKKVEGIAKKNLISVSAYSPDIGSYIEVNGNKTNIHIAFRYSTYNKKTYVWVGTPVIFN